MVDMGGDTPKQVRNLGGPTPEQGSASSAKFGRGGPHGDRNPNRVPHGFPIVQMKDGSRQVLQYVVNIAVSSRQNLPAFVAEEASSNPFGRNYSMMSVAPIGDPIHMARGRPIKGHHTYFYRRSPSGAKEGVDLPACPSYR